SSIEVEGLYETEPGRQRAQLVERHPRTESGLTAIDSDQPDRSIRVRADQRPGVAGLGKTSGQLLDGPVVDRSAVAYEQAGTADDRLSACPVPGRPIQGVVVVSSSTRVPRVSALKGGGAA